MFGMVAAFGTVQNAEAPIAQRVVLESLPISVTPDPVASAEDFWSEERFSRGDTFAALPPPFAPAPAACSAAKTAAAAAAAASPPPPWDKT